MNWKLYRIFMLCAILSFASRSYAQQTLGAIVGTVTDPTGASIPDATVKAVNLATNLEVGAQTKSNGSYQIPQLPAGTDRDDQRPAGGRPCGQERPRAKRLRPHA